MYGKLAVSNGEVTLSVESTTKSDKTVGKYGTGWTDYAENWSAGTKLCETHERFVVMASPKVYKDSEDSISECEVVYPKLAAESKTVNSTHNGSRHLLPTKVT